MAPLATWISAATRATATPYGPKCWALKAASSSAGYPPHLSRVSNCSLRPWPRPTKRHFSSAVSPRPTGPRSSISWIASSKVESRQSVARMRWPLSRSPTPRRSPGKPAVRSRFQSCVLRRASDMPRLTMAQALIGYLKNQYVERDGAENPFFAGCFGIFGHGNLAGIGQALQQTPDFRYYQSRNEQAQVHIAIGYAKMKNRLQTFACTSSIGPGATNMLTGAATATINRLPVLLLPGDIFARRNVAPVLQQLES